MGEITTLTLRGKAPSPCPLRCCSRRILCGAERPSLKKRHKMARLGRPLPPLRPSLQRRGMKNPRRWMPFTPCCHSRLDRESSVVRLHERRSKIKDAGCPIGSGMTTSANALSWRLRAWLRPGPAFLFGGEDCLSEASSAAQVTGTGALHLSVIPDIFNRESSVFRLHNQKKIQSHWMPDRAGHDRRRGRGRNPA